MLKLIPCGFCLAAVGSILLVAPTARAQAKEALMTADQTQTASEKALLLRAAGAPRNTTGMDAEAFATLVAAVEQKRFDILGAEPNSPEVKAWCDRSAKNAAQNSGDVDTKGQGRATQELFNARCSEVYQYDLRAKHTCRPAKNNETECSVDVEIKVAKFKATGDRDLSADPSFGKNGVEMVTGSGSSTSKSAASAQRSAAFTARLFAERGVRDISYFQLRAPLEDANTATSSMCLSKDILELDQPFYVYKLGEGDVKTRVGWGKVREMYDGCVMTDDLTAKEAAGRAIVLKPAKMQNIIGRGDIKAGMTAWEMPSVGLNIGAQFGMTTDAGEQFVPRIDLVAEYDLARHTGVSELHVAAHVGYVVVGKDTIDAVAKKVYDANFNSAAGSSLASQAELGLIRRWYGGRLSYELGGFVAASYYQLYKDAYASGTTVEIGAQGVGAAGKVGVGFQVSPRVALRVNAGYRYVMLSPVVKVNDVDYTEGAPGKLDAEQGFLGAVGLAYTY